LRLVGERCVLRDWTMADVRAYREWLRPEHDWHATNGPYFGPPNPNEADRAADRARAMLVDAPTPRTMLVVCTPSGDALIGMVNWYWECRETDWRRIGIGLYEPSARGRGIGAEAVRLWTRYLFDTTDALRLDLSTYSGNPAMCRAAESAGYLLEGRLRAARRWSGGVHDALIYAALRDDWR
jgi:RimJ/RimL family protein N-acetyltransferase